MKLTYFSDIPFLQAIKALFNELKVPVNYVADEPTTATEILKDTYKENSTFQLVNEVYFVGMVDDAAFEGNKSLAVAKIKSDYDGILIFGVTLNQRENNLLPTRSQLAEISRAFNRGFYYTPVVLVFKYADNKNQYIAFANTERLQYKQAWREGEKAGKVSLLRDIDIQRPHRGHEDIINQLRIQTSGTKAVDTFAKLYAYWQEVFSVSVLNKRFYQELSNWYFWAVKQVTFPGKPTEADAIKKNAKLDDLIQEHNATNVIRLLTRLLFTWFIKEKKLIPEELFDLEALQKDILKDIAPYHENGLFNQANKDSVYYRAILQNLFFASLNCPIKPDGTDSRERGFRGDGYGTHRGIDYLMRYKRYFKNPDAFLELMNKTVPFLNGGLFECLDDKYSNTYIDGFSDQMTKGEQLLVPDYLFFGTPEEVDLSNEYGVNNSTTKKAAVKGLINILKSYKFTITENTPIEEDVALDPELLGKVFENLLASYNPETKTTARKQTGSFYTPREIVNYMVDESLIAYLKSTLSFQLKDNAPEASSFETKYFNPNDEIDIHEGKLPHWNQKDVFYHVTFRLADSLPKDKIEQLKADRENWRKTHKDKKDFTKEEWKEFNRLFNQRVEEWMNNGYGSCILKKKENANIVANALKHFDGQRYVLDEWVVMPNHVHVLVKPINDNKLSDILHSWKSFTANEINKKEGRNGQLWMHESYDHIVRNEDALNAIRHYIRMNPVKANIVPGASSFGKQSQSKDALDTMLHQLASFDNYNPFANDPETTRQIIAALDRCKILDPACGSGAFPMGVLQKMVHMLQKLDPNNLIWKEVQIQKVQEETSEVFKTIDDKGEREEKLKEINNAFDQRVNDPDYARKLYLIENCIYGVDIQPIATQISKLRFFISLVVDQKCTPGIIAGGIHNNFGIRPLPNLETKFVAANTLIGINKEANLFTTDKVKDLEKQLKHIRHKLFSARTKDTKLKYRQKDEELRKAIAEELKSQGLPIDSAEKLAKWDPYDQNASSPFFDSEWMFDVAEGFDVVIGNPPYLQVPKRIFSSNQYPYSEGKDKGKQNLYKVFVEASKNISKKESGSACLIAQSSLLCDLSSQYTRELLLKETSIIEFIEFPKIAPTKEGQVFENVLQGTCIYRFINRKPNDNTHFRISINNDVTTLDKLDFEHIVQSSIFSLYPDTFYIPLIKKGDFSVIKEANNNSIRLNNLIQSISQGDINLTSSKGYFTSEYTGIKLYRGKNVQRFYLDFEVEEYLKKGFKSEKIQSNSQNQFVVCQEITGTTDKYRLHFCLTPLGDKFLFGHTANKLFLKNKSDSKSIASINNSLFMDWLFRKTSTNNHVMGYEITQFPIPKLFKSYIYILDLFYDLLSHCNEFEVSSKSIFELTLNSFVFNLYFPDHMKEREIDVLPFVERDIAAVYSELPMYPKLPAPGNQKQDAFETLSDTEKEQIIEQLHQTWSHPDSEVVKRMALFKERSPDILKPILES